MATPSNFVAVAFLTSLLSPNQSMAPENLYLKRTQTSNKKRFLKKKSKRCRDVTGQQSKLSRRVISMHYWYTKYTNKG